MHKPGPATLRRFFLPALCLGVFFLVSGMPKAAFAAPPVALSFDNTGEFGPNTPDTKTAGWQEAIDCCVANGRDLYVQGGWGGRKAVYNVSDTIRIPATQDFRIDGGIYVLN